MSSNRSSSRVLDHPQLADLKAVCRVLEKLAKEGLPADRPIDPRVVGRRAGIDAGQAEAKLLALAGMGVGRVAFQVREGRLVETFARLSDVPRVVENDLGPDVVVTPLNTTLVYFREGGEPDLSPSKPGEPRPGMRERLRHPFKKTRDERLARHDRNVRRLPNRSQRRSARQALWGAFDVFRPWLRAFTWFRAVLVLSAATLLLTAGLTLFGVIDNEVFKNLLLALETVVTAVATLITIITNNLKGM